MQFWDSIIAYCNTQDYIEVMGLSKRQYAALHGAGYSVGENIVAGGKCGLYCRWVLIYTYITLYIQ